MQACSAIICHTGTALSATHACMRSHNPQHRFARGCMQSHMLLHTLYLPHKHARSCKIRHTVMHARHSLSYKQACKGKESPILPHMLYLPHKHAYICIICHTGMHAVAYSATQGLFATHACMQAHNLLHKLHVPHM